MAEIDKEVISDKGITVLRFKGKLFFDQIIEEITRFYEKNLTDHVVWDLSCADVKNVTFDDMQKIASHAKGFGHLRSNGKTALVMSSSLAYGLGRMYDSLAQVAENPVKNRVFRSYDDAISWITGVETD